MKHESMEVKSALERGMTLPCALVRSLSRVTLGPTPKTMNLDDLIEVRFFDPQEEIRIFQDEDGLRAVRLTAGGTGLTDTHSLMNLAFGKSVTLCRELEYDEDGQAYVAATRLTDWKGGETDG